MAATEMVAGRKLDALVAERVFAQAVESLGVNTDMECGGWLICQDCEFGVDPNATRYGVAPLSHHDDSEQPCYRNEAGGPAFVVPEYSTDIAAAWEVVETLAGRGVPLDMQYRVFTAEWEMNVGGALGYGDTAPLAICRAALAAVGP